MTTAVRDPDGNALGAAAQAVFRTVEGLDGATAVWGVNTGTATAAYETYSSYYDGSDWSEGIKRSSSQNLYTSSLPTIASNFNGFSLAAWLEQEGDNGNNMYGTSLAGSTWDSATTITAYQEDDDTPVISVSPGNEEIGFLLWEKKEGDFSDIYWANYDSEWSIPLVMPGMYQFGDECAPDVAVDPEGNAFASWIYEGNYSEALTSRYDAAAGEWDATPAVLETGEFVHEFASVQTACDLNGNAIAIWDISGSNIKARYYTASTNSWSETVTVGNAEVCQYPDVAFDAYGNAMAVWVQDGNIYVSRLEAGEWPDWSPANGSPLEAEGDASSDPPQIVLDAEGNGGHVYRVYRDAVCCFAGCRSRA